MCLCVTMYLTIHCPSYLKNYAVLCCRHSRFGGTFMLMDKKGISDNPVIYHRPLPGGYRMIPIPQSSFCKLISIVVLVWPVQHLNFCLNVTIVTYMYSMIQSKHVQGKSYISNVEIIIVVYMLVCYFIFMYYIYPKRSPGIYFPINDV